ncbi:MAG: hypothetical protein QOE70_4371 [Chthoniobacter sp.]|jgi:hypothetical protein|nr:hypothetical protein [Chthoniobacter sp.]
MFVKITRDTFLSGQPAFTGETFEVDENTARQLVRTNKGQVIEAPEDQPAPEPPKPKVKKVSGKPEAPAA